jgi:sugar O-acyltransferase (sialic acid O-acetyltransferase NeuD family)
MKPKMFVFGATSFAEIAAEYFDRENLYEVVGHIVDPEYLTGDHVGSRPLFALGSEDANQLIAECTHFFVASTYTSLNRFRQQKLQDFKNLGLVPASYVSKNAFLDPTVELGEHVFIFENNVLQFGVKVGNNCVLWSGNHVGHHSSIKDNVFISSHVVVSGHCSVGMNSFLGVNVTIYNNVDIGQDNWIGAGSIVGKSTPDDLLMRQEFTKASAISAKKFFKLT